MEYNKNIKIRDGREWFSSLSHAIGALCSVAVLVLMIIWSAHVGSPARVVGSIIFGVSLVLLYIASSLYHFFSGRNKIIWRRIDHSMIYVLIAGTYTPICLALPSKGWGWALFGVVWFGAVVGIILKSKLKYIDHWIFTVLYILLGWIIIIAILPLINWLSFIGFGWLLLGGFIYTVGVFFFLIDHYNPSIKIGWLTMHDVFHLFVIAGSVSHILLMWNYVIPVR